MVYNGLSVPHEETCGNRHVAGTDNDIRLLVIYFHLPNDVWHGEPCASIRSWRCAHAHNICRSAFQGTEGVDVLLFLNYLC